MRYIDACKVHLPQTHFVLRIRSNFVELLQPDETLARIGISQQCNTFEPILLENKTFVGNRTCIKWSRTQLRLRIAGGTSVGNLLYVRGKRRTLASSCTSYRSEELRQLAENAAG